MLFRTTCASLTC